MSEAAHPSDNHPSPHRSRVNLVVLIAGLAASPFGWVLQLIAGYAVSSYACFPNDAPFEQPPWPGEAGLLAAINLACLAITLAGGAVSLVHWRRSSGEMPGNARVLLDVGEGRTRFLAGWGVLLSLGFAAAILFNTVTLLTVPACWRMAP